MDVKDYSQKLEKSREQFKTAQDDLRSSYNKNTEEIKENLNNKIVKQAEVYNAQKADLEEQNSISNQTYSDKTKKIISEKQEAFRNAIKQNTEKFDVDRNQMKTDFTDKLTDLNDSYSKSTTENNRFHEQAKKTMSDRYMNANRNSKKEFDNEVDGLTRKVKDTMIAEKEKSRGELKAHDRENQKNLEDLRATGEENKFKDVSRLRNDNDNLHANFEQERKIMREQQADRMADIVEAKNKENLEEQKNFSNLQQGIRQKNLASEERLKAGYQNESNELKKRFKEDLHYVEHLSNQKGRGGTETVNLKNENKILTGAYENRLQAAHAESQKNREEATKKENEMDTNYREKFRQMKADNTEKLERHDAQLNSYHQNKFQEARDKNNTLVDRYKSEIGSTKINSENKVSRLELKSKAQLKNQQVELDKYLNNINDKKLEEISVIKSEFNKDKSHFIEKTKRDFTDEKMVMKDEFNHQIAVKDDLYEKKLEEMEKQTNKIIGNYEARISQLARKAENEVEILKNSEGERKTKEQQANKILFDSQERQHQMELGNIRDKYERMIGKDRIIGEVQTNRIVQKYEDQIEKERMEHQKDMSMKLNESQAQLERLFKASELEKETLRNQYEQRMENMKLAEMSKEGRSKKV